jgi:hypothetical protein
MVDGWVRIMKSLGLEPTRTSIVRPPYQLPSYDESQGRGDAPPEQRLRAGSSTRWRIFDYLDQVPGVCCIALLIIYHRLTQSC